MSRARPRTKPQKSKVIRFLISAGPTVEDIDPVRFISNRASGLLGVELALAAKKAGHSVTLVHGPLAEHAGKRLGAPKFDCVPVRSAAQMHAAMLEHAQRADVIVMNAAVADYAPAEASPVKLKKSGAVLSLKLKPTPDILKELGGLKRKNQTLIGFALETGSGHSEALRKASRENEALRKLVEKNADVMVLDTPAAIGGPSGDFDLLVRTGAGHVGALAMGEKTKREFARLLIELVAERHGNPAYFDMFLHSHGPDCGCEH